MEPLSTSLAIVTATGTLWPLVRDELQKQGEDLIKEECKSRLKGLFKKDQDPAEEWQKAADKALAQSLGKFIESAEVELRKKGMSNVGAYAAAYADLLASGAVQAELASSLQGTRPRVKVLTSVWKKMKLRALPQGYSWLAVLQEFHTAIVVWASRTPMLKATLDTTILDRLLRLAGQIPDRTPGYDLPCYRKALIHTHGTVKLRYLATEADTRTPLSMLKVFVEPSVIDQAHLPAAFYKLPQEEQKLLREGRLSKHHALDAAVLKQFTQMLSQASRQPAIAFATAPSQRLIVLTGDPGSGKSTLLQHLALEWAERPVPDGGSGGPVPFLIELRRFAEQNGKTVDGGTVKDFPSYLEHGTGEPWNLNAKEVKKALKEGGAWLLLDGYDEVFDPKMRKTVLACLTKALIAWPEARIILTTRPFGYEPEALQAQGFMHAHVQNFDDAQIALFLKQWHEQVAGADADSAACHARLTQQLQHQPRLHLLALNPLLLTMMALLNRTSRLPDQRAKLYSLCVDLLVHEWDARVHDLPSGPVFGTCSKDGMHLDLEHKRALLRAVAYHMQTVENALAHNIIEKGPLRRTLAQALPSFIIAEHREPVAKALVEQLQGRNHILASLGTDGYSFVHRTFLEYCCAEHYLFVVEKEGSLSNDGLFDQAFAPHWEDDSWREILMLITSQLNPARLKVVLERMLQAVPKSEDPAGSPVIFATYLLSEKSNRKGLAEVEAELRKKITGMAEDCAGLSGVLTHSTHLANYLTMHALVAAMAAWPRHRDLHALLLRIADHANDSNQMVASRLLAQGWQGDPQVRSELEVRLLHSSDYASAKYYAAALVAGWKDDDLFEWLASTVKQKNSAVGDGILKEMCYGWCGDERVRELLLNQASSNFLPSVITSWHRLAEGWPNDPAIYALLQEAAVKDANAVKRGYALEVLTQHWPTKPETLTALEHSKAKDENANVRAIAEGLLEGKSADDVRKERTKAFLAANGH